MSETMPHERFGRTKYLLVAAAVVLAFFAAYGIAAGRFPSTSVNSSIGAPVAGELVDPAASDPSDAAVSAFGGSCCGAGSEAVETTGSAVVEGDVQRIAVDVSAGYFQPSVILVEAGVPVELAFSQGAGCMAEVMFKDFGVFENLANGGAVVSLPELEPGAYGFSCGMEMVFGTVLAE